MSLRRLCLPAIPQIRRESSGQRNRTHAVPDARVRVRSRFNPAALLPASASAAKAEAEEAIPAPEGKLFSLITSARSCNICHAANDIENIGDTIQPLTRRFMPVDDQLIIGQ